MSNPNPKDAVYTNNVCKNVPEEVREIGRQCHIPEAALDSFHEAGSLKGSSVSIHHNVLKNHLKHLVQAAIEFHSGNSGKPFEEWEDGSRRDHARKIFLFDQKMRDNDNIQMAITAPLFYAESRPESQVGYSDLSWPKQILHTFIDVDLTRRLIELEKPTENHWNLSVPDRWNFCCGLLRRALQVLEVKDVFGNKGSIGDVRIEHIWKGFEKALEANRGSICSGEPYTELNPEEAGRLRLEFVSAPGK